MHTQVSPQTTGRPLPRREAVAVESVSVQPMRAFPDAPERSSSRDSRTLLRVLVVDDEPVNRILAMAHLRAIDILPLTASDGLEAVRMSRCQDFDIILMDVDMPVMDGISAAAIIRDDQARKPPCSHSQVVAFTASELPDERLLRHVGIDRILRKPCSFEDMGRCISACCESLTDDSPSRSPRIRR
jgi:CheY-like chemotaxis protein